MRIFVSLLLAMLFFLAVVSYSDGCMGEAASRSYPQLETGSQYLFSLVDGSSTPGRVERQSANGWVEIRMGSVPVWVNLENVTQIMQTQ